MNKRFGICCALFILLSASNVVSQTDSLQSFFKYFFNNQFNRARAEIERCIEQDSSAAHLYFYLGKTCLALNDYHSALKAFQTSLRKGFAPSQIYSQMGKVFEEQGQLADAVDAYKVAMKFDPEFKHLRIKIISLYFKRKNYRAVIALGKKLLKKNPGQSKIYFFVVRSHLQRSEDDSAMAIAQRAVSMDSNSTPNLLNLGIALFKKEKYDSSIKTFQRVLAISPHSDEAKYYLAKNLAKKNDLSSAIELLQDCIRLEGLYRLKAMKLLVQYFYELHQLDDAIKCAREYLSEKPQEGAVHYYLARALSDKGNLLEAEKEFEKASKFSGQNFVKMIYFYRGLNFYQNGQDGKAIPWYKKAIAIDAEFSYAYYNLALVYDRYYEDKNPAIRYYEKFIKLAENDKTVPPLVLIAAKQRVAQLREQRFFEKR